MGPFLTVLLITILAFSDALLQISRGNEGKDQFVVSYVDSVLFTYRMILGDWDVANFGSVSVAFVWSLFLLCTLFNMIVMLNLLIAIISETFAQVNSNAPQAALQQQASMIAENSYLIPL